MYGGQIHFAGLVGRSCRPFKANLRADRRLRRGQLIDVGEESARMAGQFHC